MSWRRMGLKTIYTVEGLVSFGAVMCGFADLPAVYTRVRFYLPWILDHLEK